MRALPLVLLCLVASLSGCVRRVALLPPDDPNAPVADPPPGMVQVNVVAETGQTWEVRAGGPPICQTPCTETVNASSSLLLTSRHGRLLVPAMAVEAPGAQRALVVIDGTNEGERINGIVFTTLGGMGAIAGITLTAVGCSNTQERAGMCTAGLITAGVTLALTAVSIWMIIDSAPSAHVLPVFKTNATNGLPPVTFALTPTGIAGTF